MSRKKIPLITFIIIAVLLLGTAVLIACSNNRRAEVRVRMTEIAASTASASLPTETAAPEAAAAPTEAPTETAAEVPTALPTEAPAALDPADWQNWPELPESVNPKLKALYFEGIADGNDPARFSKVGDSNTVMPSFLGCFDSGEGTGYDLGPYTELKEVIAQFQWSFSRNSRAAKNGATAYDMDVYHWYTDDVCWPYESALSCEYRLFTPSIAFIGFGTNDALLDIELYEEHLRSLVQKTLDRKIVPILLTKADNLEGDGSFNKATAKIAAEFNVPLWNLWRAMSELPNNGLKDGDVHPTSSEISLCNFAGSDLENYGWTVRNLSALKALDRVWRLLNDMPIHAYESRD